MTRAVGGASIGSGSAVRSLRQFDVAVGASNLPPDVNGTIGVVRRQVTWPEPYGDVGKLSVVATAVSLGDSSAVFAMSFSKMSATGASLDVVRVDVPRAPWDDVQLRAHVTVTEFF
eukprot:TRINITY_DN7755_c0_g1_i2.p3 TRINITY_DN7755_c0_g1~~TRINITY_DN7755_c0_g1_i2.p3  ORF type:complete len:116 (-),score=32.88 TRINITY_DN7755_c0_g1_i2:67-414(-)